MKNIENVISMESLFHYSYILELDLECEASELMISNSDSRTP